MCPLSETFQTSTGFRSTGFEANTSRHALLASFLFSLRGREHAIQEEASSAYIAPQVLRLPLRLVYGALNVKPASFWSDLGPRPAGVPGLRRVKTCAQTGAEVTIRDTRARPGD